MTTTSKTIADQISALLHDDGQRWTSDSGETLAELCAKRGPRHITRADDERWVFEDGSVITACGGGWDLGYADCWCWQGAGHSDECSDGEAE